ncbi:MDR family MFS transporter [Streptomyces justiciae]|uniref:MDR family MFS transporter n=1 Tax=Streptomyces justiciae TaxID=2780140 RepID=UPI0021177795|nr:MFS transporter [Streptomyces justiciae]MCW8377167.1 MFS transporter [Streptomyces justiciae]
MADTAPLHQRLRQLPRSAWVIFAGMFLIKFGNFLNVFLVLFLVSRGYSTAQAGLAVAAVGLGTFVGNMIGGTVADRFGRRSAIAVSMFGSAAATAAVPFTDGLVTTTALVCLVGVFAQLYRPAAGALLVDVVDGEQRVMAFAVLRLAVNVGMAVGPLVGGLLSGHSYTYVFAGDALFSVAFGTLALLLLPAGRPAQAPVTASEAAGKGGYREVFTDRPYVLFLLSMVAATFVYGQTTATLPLHVTDAGFSNTVYGLLLGLNALLCVVIELPLTRHTERRDPRRVIALGLLLLGAGMGLTGAMNAVWLLALTVVLWTVAETIYTPIANAYPAEFSPAHLRGRYQGAEGLAHTLGGTLGPAVGGLLYGINAPLHWTVCAAVAVLGAVLVLGAKPGVRQTETPAEQTPEPVPATTN